MNPRKRIPATLTAILAILALTACGETPKGDVQGTVNNPDPGYVRWYELPDVWMQSWTRWVPAWFW